MHAEAPRVLIAATASGVGKTTVACGLLRALARRGMRLSACKCGPDYLDPQFHSAVLNVPSRNLDLFLSSEAVVRSLVAEGARDADLTLIEGAMGYYDGIAQGLDASAFDVARATQTPVVLVADARGRALSVAAEVAGFARFREPSHVAGVILNRVTAARAEALANAVRRETGLAVLGWLPPMDDAALTQRHLGLVAAAEVADLRERLDALADTMEKTIDLHELVRLAASAAPLHVEPPVIGDPCASRPVIAVARDAAFSFTYPDSLALLERLGARLAFFSPLRDASVPAAASGLYLCGGYPELHAEALSRNEAMRASVRAAVAGGMPTIAECGGFLYLHDELEDERGRSWPMAGALRGRAFKGGRLGRFGYVTLQAREDGLLCGAGERLRAHEFHYWESSDPGRGFHAQKPQSARGWDCVVSTPSLYAGFPHLYLRGEPKAARRFVEACAAYGAVREAGRGASRQEAEG